MSQLKIVAVPRDPNPYQELLYGQMRARGVRIRYGSALTPLHSLNLLLLPLELLCSRGRGYRVLHLHWTFGFRFAGAERSLRVRRLSRAWFAFVLAVAGRVGLRIVWTAHNVLPHAPVFDDDLTARRTLVRRCDLVITHSQDTVDQLQTLGIPPWRHQVVAMGPMASDALLGLTLPRPGARRRLLFFGRLAAYKGLDDLVDAAEGLDHRLEITIAGACRDAALAARLRSASGVPGANIRLILGHIPDSDVPALFAASDVLVFPFRTVTTPSSLMLGLAAGRCAIIPDLPALRNLPDDAVIRYPPGRCGLRQALRELPDLSGSAIEARGRAARKAAQSGPGWDEIAAATLAAMRELSDSPGGHGRRIAVAPAAGTRSAGR